MITKAMFLKYMDEIDQEVTRGDLKLHNCNAAFTCLTEKVDKWDINKSELWQNIEQGRFY
ncbi:hypothetical protein QQA33_08930 [Vibrio parahaemolyticus]|uniref:hypothetical protein n=1 Tax=Vibrio parahaemolyticus TaxID=670 RepID=UPI002555432A|nr:hypothetical protein [Vibrio parahaemolyticus]MDK9437908.1 hypothetical protein [Vibrio parahaemolyticus]